MAQNPSPFDNLGQSSMSSQPLSGQKTGGHDAIFRHSTYTIRRKFLKLLGAAFYVDDPSGQVVLFAELKAFKLKEDIRLYTGEDKSVEVLRIGARSIIDFSATYDVFDSATNQQIGALKRQGLKSIARDAWTILDSQGREIGKIEEDSLFLALLRRFIEYVSFFLPQKYSITVGNQNAGTLSQSKNPFWIKIAADFTPDTAGVLDRRLALAAGILMSAIEGKQA